MTARDLRRFSEQVRYYWEAGKIKSPVHLAGGNEEQLIRIFRAVGKDDYVFSTHRSMYHALLAGVPESEVLDEVLGRPEGCSRGCGRSMGLFSPAHRFYSSAIVGGCLPISVGVARAIKDSKKSCHVWTFVGDGACDEGIFWTAVRYATAWELPVTFVIEDNDRSTCTDGKTRWNEFTVNSLLEDNEYPNIVYYKYTPKHCHVGSGKYVQF